MKVKTNIPFRAQLQILGFANRCPLSALLLCCTPGPGPAQRGWPTHEDTLLQSVRQPVRVREACPAATWDWQPLWSSGEGEGGVLLKITNSKVERNQNIYTNHTISAKFTTASWLLKSGSARTDCQTNCHL